MNLEELGLLGSIALLYQALYPQLEIQAVYLKVLESSQGSSLASE